MERFVRCSCGGRYLEIRGTAESGYEVVCRWGCELVEFGNCGDGSDVRFVGCSGVGDYRSGGVGGCARLALSELVVAWAGVDKPARVVYDASGERRGSVCGVFGVCLEES